MPLTYRRLDQGQPIRDAMKRQRVTLQALSAATKELDPEGHGVSFQLVAFLRSGRKWSRDTTTERSAHLISAALGVPVWELFAADSPVMPADSALARN